MGGQARRGRLASVPDGRDETRITRITLFHETRIRADHTVPRATRITRITLFHETRIARITLFHEPRGSR